MVPLSLRIQNDIPIGKGCGSSAAARLAGIALANHFGRLRWTDSQIIGEASRREHHPDNVSACWMGGLTIARMSGETETQVVASARKESGPCCWLSPGRLCALKTLGASFHRNIREQTAVVNIQNSMLLLAAFMQGRHELLSSALEDRIHQPYRAPLCPLLPCLHKLTGKQGISGCRAQRRGSLGHRLS